MNKKSKRFLAAVVSLFVVATTCCGCGGGGSGSGKAGQTAVRVLLAAIDAAPLDAYSSENVGVLATTRFGDQAEYFNVREGAQIFSLTISQTTRTVFSVPLTVANRQRQTILVYGNRDKLGLRVSTFVDSAGEISGDQSAIRVIHAMVGAGQLDCQMLDTALCTGLQFGSVSNYTTVPKGLQRITVQRSGDKKVLINRDFDLQGGKAYSLLATGEVDYFVTSSLLQDN